MTKILYLDCSSGISGDMFLGSLIDCGVDINYLTFELRKIKLNGYTLKAHKVKRNRIVGTKFDCIYNTNDIHFNARTFKDIVKLINTSSLASEIKEKAISVFENLANSESRVHQVPIKEVHFHEVGSVDSIVDIIGSSIAIKKLEIDEIYSSPLNLAKPAPATAHLLKSAQVEFSGLPYELVTPTGAAIIKTFSNGFGPVPPMKILKVGFGAGTYEIPNHPNILKAIVGEEVNPVRNRRFSNGVSSLETDVVTVIETNIDDMNPQGYEYLMERLFKAGALDVYLTPVIMKKSRPGCIVTVLTEPSKADKISEIIFEETPSLGLRQYQAARRRLERKVIEVKTKFGKVRVKLGFLGDELKVVSPEYEDCKRIAKSKALPFRRIYEETKSAAMSKCRKARA